MSKTPKVPFNLARIDIAGQSTLVVYGELDIVTSPRLHETLSGLIAEHPGLVLVDMANVTFIDSSGLGALVAADRRLRDHGGQLRIVAASDRAAKVFELTGLSERFHLYSEIS